MLIMMSTSITYTAVSMNQVAELAETVGEKQIQDFEQATEEFEIVKISIDNAQFNMTIKNTGDLPIHMTRLWVENTTAGSTWLPAKYEMDLDIGSGQTVTSIGQNIGLTAIDTQSYMMDLISDRETLRRQPHPSPCRDTRMLPTPPSKRLAKNQTTLSVDRQ